MHDWDSQLRELLEEYKPKEDEPLRTARRPAGKQLLIERWTLPGGRSTYRSQVDFWLSTLHHFLEDTGSDIRWFEGLAYQSVFVELEPMEFQAEYRELQQRLILPPLETVFLTKAYRALQGKVVSYLGQTEDGDWWSGTFGPCYFGD